MPQPKELINKDERLLDYLLGLLPEEDVERLDEESIADDDVAARLSAVEDDLVDAYVTETLDPGTRARFETVYLMSPQRREKVKFARRFLAAVNRVSAPSVAAVPVTSPGSERVRRFFPRPEISKPQERRARFSWTFVTAAASMALACGLLVNDLQLREGLNQALQLGAAQDQRAQMLARQLDQARNENVEIAQALEQARAASTPVERPASSGSSPSMGSAGLAGTRAVVLFLQTRSIEPVPVVDLPSNADDVAFELRLESNEFPQYRARLKDPGTNRTVWQSAELHARSMAPISVTLVVPAHLLESKHYSFELAGIDRAGHETTTGTYAVQIDRR